MAKGKYHDWLTQDGLMRLEAWARDGLTDEQIASNMGISPATLYKWKNAFEEIVESLKKGKDVVDIQVENALFKRAIGYTYVETTQERIVDYDSETGAVVGSHLETTKKVTKEIAPDVTAQIFWLKNRKPELWRDVKSIDANLKNTINPTNEELDAEIKRLNVLLGIDESG